jgi:arylsulfatase A-like enzyme
MEGEGMTMTRRDFLQSSALATAAALAPYPSNAKGMAAKGVPNILFINVDQLSILDSISAYGAEHLKTPGMDRLVKHGTSFMQSYATDPVCCPARTSWWTSMYSSENGVLVNSTPCNPGVPDLSRQLQGAGYSTYFVGKWHVPGKEVRDLFHVLHEGSWWGEATDPEITRTASTFFENYDGAAPFFLNLGYMNPHDICITPDYDDQRARVVNGKKDPPYLREGILEDDDLPPLPAAHGYDEREPAILVSCKRGSHKNPKHSDWNEDMWRIHRYNYHRFTEMVDTRIDQLLDALENSRFRDNTVIVFTSDHGDGMSRHHTYGKTGFYDEVCRVPFIVASLGDLLNVRKNVKDGQHLVSGIDLGRTVCDYAQADSSALPHGLSVRPLAEGRNVKWRDYLYAESGIYMHMVTDGRIKYVREYVENDSMTFMPPSSETHQTGVEQLFDLERDPDEQTNFAYDPEYAAQLKMMRTILDQKEKECLPPRKAAAFAQKYMTLRAGAIKRLNIPQRY